MILEIAQIDVKPGMENDFEAGVKSAVPLFKRAKGCKGMTLQRSHEKPARYRLFVQWETLENHTVDFRGSADFQEWRKLVGHCFASPPEVEHVREVRARRFRTSMKRSSERILTTHTGSLPRTAKVVELLLAEQEKPGARRAELAAAVREAVAACGAQANRMRPRHHQ